MAEEILYVYQVLFFFFQAEDGIRDLGGRGIIRSEEHTSELQSRSDLVCRLLLGKKKHPCKIQSRSELVCRLLLVISMAISAVWSTWLVVPTTFDASTIFSSTLSVVIT